MSIAEVQYFFVNPFIASQQSAENDKYFEVFITMNQLEVIAPQMPLGYSLQFSKPIGQYVSRHSNNQKKSSGGGNKTQQSLATSNQQLSQLSLQPRQSSRKTQLAGQNFTQFNKLQTFGSNQKPRNNAQLQQTLKICYKILTQLKKNESAGPFLYPVNPQKLGLPDYFDIIKNPMDLSSVDKKLRQGIYNNEREFQQDMKLIWNNSYLYNMKGSDIYLMTREMEASFDKQFGERFSSSNPESYAQLYQTVNQLQNKLNQMTGKTEKFKGKKQVKPKSDYDINNKLRPLTFEEKQALGQKIRNLSSTYFEGILDIVKNSTSNQNQENIEFDINKLPTKTARELEKYVNDKLSRQSKKDNQNIPQGTKQQQQQSVKAQKMKQNKQWNQFPKMQSPMDPLIPQSAIQYQSEEQQQKLLEQRMEVHQQMMKLKQQQESQTKSSDKNIVGQIPQMQQQFIQPQMQQFAMGQNNQIQPNQMQNYQSMDGQIMQQQELEDDEKKSMSSFLTDSEDDSI